MKRVREDFTSYWPTFLCPAFLEKFSIQNDSLFHNNLDP